MTNTEIKLLLVKGILSDLTIDERMRHDAAYDKVSKMYQEDPSAMGTAMSIFLLEKAAENEKI